MTFHGPNDWDPGDDIDDSNGLTTLGDTKDDEKEDEDDDEVKAAVAAVVDDEAEVKKEEVVEEEDEEEELDELKALDRLAKKKLSEGPVDLDIGTDEDG